MKDRYENSMENMIRVSSIGKTWILDLDGTLVRHNGYIIDGYDTFLDGAEEFLKNIPTEDMVLIVTSRARKEKELTEKFLSDNGIRYNQIIYEAPYGERILINDRKPSGLETAIAINSDRDAFCSARFFIDKSL